MKLLIVDDEELTRNGLISALDWASMGIESVLTADDGLNGLAIAKKELPDILLCDVRMPRLNGIEMLEKILEFSPNIAAIFMSGYSDKEYLKSAIKLNAINYIEKPIDEKELESAIHQAIEMVLRLKRQNEFEEANTNLIADSLAYNLTIPYLNCKNEVDSLSKLFLKHYSSDKFQHIITFIVKLEAASEASSELAYIYQNLRTTLSAKHLHIIYSEKRLFHLVYHVYSETPMADSTVKWACEAMQDSFRGFGNFYITIGDQVKGIENAYKSYESAVILLQYSFFFKPGNILYNSIIEAKSNSLPFIFEDKQADYNRALTNNDLNSALSVLESIHFGINESISLMPNAVKSFYFELFNLLYQQRSRQKLTPDLSIESNENIMDIMDSCFCYDVLHNILLEKTKAYFEDSNTNVSENKTIYLIKNYISTNYANASLSVKDISDYAHLSVSYLCTFFKAETGTTLNQYITEFRIQKAKQLLVDPRNKVSEISSLVGYNDGNYFGKSFKKMVGLSPSEYREKVMK